MEWLQLDHWNRATGKKFEGGYPDLAAHLLQPLTPGVKASVTLSVETLMLGHVLHHKNERVRTSVALLTTPWGVYRWIPAPHSRP